MIKSVNQIRLELAEIQANHKQLNSFFWGDFLRAYKENRLNYPLMGAFYPTSTLLRNQTQLQLRIYIADKLYKDWSNLNDIESDTLQTCRDIYNTMNNSTRWQTIGRVQSCSVTKFINRGGDEVAGHEMTMNFLIRDRDGVCGLPMDGYDFDQITGALCSPVQIYENGLLVATVASGGIYSYDKEDSTYSITDTDGNVLYSGSISSGGTLTQPISDSTAILKDTAGTTISTTSILAEGSKDITAPDATYLVEYVNGTDIQSGSIVSGGSVVVQVTNPITPPDTSLEVNGVSEGSVVAGSTVDVQLSDSGGVVVPDSVTLVGTDLQIVLADAPYSPSDFRPNKSGAVISYADYDGGYYQRGRDVSFYKLSSNNPYGNTWRFTGVGGGYYDHDTSQYKDINGTVTTLALAYPNSIMIDWDNRTANAVMLWKFTSEASGTWDVVRVAALSLTIGGLSTWYLPETVEYDTLRNWGSATHFQWLPINTTVPMWTANTNPGSTTVAWYVNGIQFAGAGKANSISYLPCRFTLLSEIGL